MIDRRLVAVVSLACACSGSSTPSTVPSTGAGPALPPATPPVFESTPVTPSPPGPPPPSVGAGNGLTLTTTAGLYLLDPPLAGEPAFDGYVEVALAGAPLPDRTVVELNGVALVPCDLPGPRRFWKLDPTGPQPRLGPGGTAVLTARTGGLVRTVPLACPADVPIESSAPLRGSLRGSGALALRWAADLMTNADNPFPTDYYVTARLSPLDADARTLGAGDSVSRLVPRGTHAATLPVPSSTASGFVAEVRWPGPFASEAGSRGFCGRAKRIVYAN